MHDHNGAVFPHHSDREPQDNADDEGEHIPRHDVEPGEAIAHQLNGGSDPFDDIDRLHGVSLEAHEKSRPGWERPLSS